MRGDAPDGPIRWRMHLPLPPAKVFAALDSDDGRAGFWADSAIERDGIIEFHFANGYRHRARILEREPPRRFVIEYFAGPVSFELDDDGDGGTELLMTHEGVAAAEWNEVHAGWLNVLFPMKAWLVHGVDLRNHDPDRTWDEGYADQ